jgi:poly(3-hydroxybutyrate) depolymerase
MEDLKAWAEENGYAVVIPVYDLEVPDDLDIDISDQEAESIDLDDVNDLLDDLYSSEGE